MIAPVLGSSILSAWHTKSLWHTRAKISTKNPYSTSVRPQRSYRALHLSLIVPGQRSPRRRGNKRAGPERAQGLRSAVGRCERTWLEAHAGPQRGASSERGAAGARGRLVPPGGQLGVQLAPKAAAIQAPHQFLVPLALGAQLRVPVV